MNHPEQPPNCVNLLVPTSSPCAVCWTAAQRLSNEYGAAFPVNVITAVVAGCVTDLAGVPRGTVPELAERLAHHRLKDALENGVDARSTSWVRAGNGRCALTPPATLPFAPRRRRAVTAAS